MNNYKDLKIWQKSFQLSVDIYRSTQSFPDTEKFGLVSQMRRSAVSIFSNIAEGHGRSSDKDFSRFLNMSIGSTNELEGQILISKELGYINAEKSDHLTHNCQEILKMIVSFKQKLS